MITELLPVPEAHIRCIANHCRNRSHCKYLTHAQARESGMQLEGTRRFGEAAIGTNDRITRMSRNILFDEKIGGTVHMAIGQSYLQCGGKNKSTVHWDMITDMTADGRIRADGILICENGRFLI